MTMERESSSQAICWLADMILSTDGQLQLKVASKPLMKPQSTEAMIVDIQAQIQTLSNHQQHVELSLVTLCLSKMLIALAKLALQLGLQWCDGAVALSSKIAFGGPFGQFDQVQCKSAYLAFLGLLEFEKCVSENSGKHALHHLP